MGVTFGSPIKDVYVIKDDSGNLVDHTGDLIETTLKSYTVPGGILGINGAIKFYACGSSFGNVGNKTYKLKFGATIIYTLTVAPAVGTVNWLMRSKCYNLGAENSQNWSLLVLDELTIDYNWARIGCAEDTSVDQILYVTGQLVNAADQVRIGDWTVEIRPAG